MLQYNDGRTFTKSLTEYLDHIEGRSENRICIPVKFADLPRTIAVVDTGAPWSILNSQEASAYDPDYRSNATEPKNIEIRGASINGVLIRLPVTLCAEDGEDLEIEGTIFIPNDDIQIPNFIGLEGILNRIKFAIDPQENHFFFGAY